MSRVPLLLLLLLLLLALTSSSHVIKIDPKATWLAGASTVIITPPVNGTTDYVIPISEFDSSSPGTVVPEFDQGLVSIGNGDKNGNWVRDHVFAYVVAIRGADNRTLVVSGADVYMLFGPDIEIYKDRVRRAIGDLAFDLIDFLPSSTHNHHVCGGGGSCPFPSSLFPLLLFPLLLFSHLSSLLSLSFHLFSLSNLILSSSFLSPFFVFVLSLQAPDTSGLSLNLNREWFSSLLDHLVEATLDAIKKMEPVTLTVADSDWRFGQGDKRDPILTDPTLNVLQATSLATGRVIATVVQWSFHPEVTLGFSPTVPPADCLALGEAAGCSARGRYISADFPGHLRSYLTSYYPGSDVIYINGPLGNQIGAHGPVWEVSEEFPITGDGSVPPPGATLLPGNFRKALLIGRELANAVVNTLAGPRAQVLPVSEISFRSHDTFTRMNNVLFRAGLAPRYLRPNQPLVIGYALRDLFICKEGLEPSDDNCVSDNYETIEVLGFAFPLRKGEFARAKVSLVQFGPVSMFTIPGELAPEIANGLPADFDEPESVPKYFKNPGFHPVGPDYIVPGVLKDMIRCDYCWTFGLTNDAAGYIFPRSDWRFSCKGPVCEGPGYITGDRCKEIIDSGDEVGRANCLVGQVVQYEDHYEETISAGWDVAEDVVMAYSALLGVPPSGRFTKDDWTQ